LLKHKNASYLRIPHTETGDPLTGVNPEYQVGQLGCPNPSANPVGVVQGLSFGPD
jgi:hypothetical protein